MRAVRWALAVPVVVVALSLIPLAASVRADSSAGTVAATATFTNPVATGRSDPHIIASGGRYYLTSTDGCVAGYMCVWESATTAPPGSTWRR